MAGWIKLHRVIREHAFFKERRKFSRFEAWLDMLLEANHTSKQVLLGNEMISCERGSFITSEIKLMERWRWSKSKVRAFILLLVNEQMIVKKTDTKKTTITIVNYEVYQNSQTTEELQKNCKRTAKELQKDTTKNVKNVKNVKNDLDSLSQIRFADDSPPIILSEYLYNKIITNDPRARQPNYQRWAEHMDKLLRIDKRTEHEIRQVIDFCQSDSFWKANVLSTKKLREKFSALVIKAKDTKGEQPFMRRNVATALRLVESAKKEAMEGEELF